MKINRALIALAAAATLTAAPAAAQELLLPATPEKGVWLEAAYSDFHQLDVSVISTVWYLSGRLPVGERTRVVVDVPVSHARMDLFGTGEESSSVMGNPYLGVEFAASPRLLLEAGVRAPLTTANDESFADVTALLSDPMRAEAFAEDVVPLYGAATLRHAVSERLGLRARAGATALFQTGDEGGSTEGALDYGLAGTYAAGRARVALGLTGRWHATAEGGSFGDNSMHRAGVSADVRVGRVRPGVSLRVPLDEDMRAVVNSTVGLYLQVPVR